jgi:hypothetical protein
MITISNPTKNNDTRAATIIFISKLCGCSLSDTLAKLPNSKIKKLVRKYWKQNKEAKP